MNKKELITKVAENTGAAKVLVEKIIENTLSTMTDTLVNGDKVQLTGWGTFKVTDRAAREGMNPQTGEAIHIPAKKAPSFSAGQALKNAVNN